MPAACLPGPALTVKTRPGDNLMVHKALLMAEPGDIIVVDAGGDLTNAIIGELMLSYAMQRGVAGVVIYGACATPSDRQHRFPVYASGITHRGPYKDGPGKSTFPCRSEACWSIPATWSWAMPTA